MSTEWSEENEAQFQELTRRQRELATKREEILGSRQKAVETIATILFEEAGFPDGASFDISSDPAIFAGAMRSKATAVRAALKPYDQSEPAA